MKGINLAEQGHPVNILPPVDINGAGATSDYFSMKYADHASIMIQAGLTGAASTVTLFKSKDNAGTDEEAIPFKYWAEETDAGDALERQTDATAAGFATSTNDNIMYGIEIDAAALGGDFTHLAIKASDPTVATLISAMAILTGNKYDGDQSPTVID